MAEQPRAHPTIGRSPRSVEDLLSRWPSENPLVCCVSSGDLNDWNRYSVFASPTASLTHDLATGRTAYTSRTSTPAPAFTITHDPVADLHSAIESSRHPNTSSHPDLPFAGGWIGVLSYELGRSIEPRTAARTRPADNDAWPAYTLLRCPGALVHDRMTNTWFAVGEPATIPTLLDDPHDRPFTCSPFASDTGRTAYERAVARTVAYTHAGDIYQANIAHRLSATLTGSPRAAFARTLAGAQPWFGGYAECDPDRAVLSASPELFLRLSRDGELVTRPIKGTVVGDGPPDELIASEKNAAELAMIVDLMRNDLGRVCERGSVRVRSARELERHAPSSPLYHTTATVTGRACESTTRADILRATFPPGSITGAPKVRAMQIIDELEPCARGPYTGSLALFCDSGAMSLSVAIRTGAFTREPGNDAWRIRMHAGAGIVADSDPSDEWHETIIKARGLAHALGTTIEETP